MVKWVVDDAAVRTNQAVVWCNRTGNHMGERVGESGGMGECRGERRGEKFFAPTMRCDTDI